MRQPSCAPAPLSVVSQTVEVGAGMVSRARVRVSLPSEHGNFNELSDMSEVTYV